MRRKTRRLAILIATLASLAALVVVVTFCVRAQVGANDYVEWRNDGGPPPERPGDRAQWDEAQWAKWRTEFEQWERKRWSFHVRANPDAIFAFGGHRLCGSVSVHLYYWVLVPALAAV